MSPVRPTVLVILFALSGALAACGDDPSTPAPGSAENPLVSRHGGQDAARKVDRAERSDATPAQGPSVPDEQDRDGAAQPPGYAALVERQSSRPRTRFTPCDLVSRARAQDILGTYVLEPVEAPMGPTCIYRSRSGKDFVTVAVQRMDLDKTRSKLPDRVRMTVAERIAYCARQGQPMLYLSLSDDRVLTVAAPCEVARRFAAAALPRLSD